jgi:hypothetical protein
MKVSIPLDSTLCTDSHKNDIKDPLTSNDLLSKNQSYFINNYLTNPKKQVIPAGDYITTKADMLEIKSESDKTQIYYKGSMVADVMSLGVEDTMYLDKDDAVIHEGFLWTVRKGLNGFFYEQMDLMTKEAVNTTFVDNESSSGSEIRDVRIIRNTHKVIVRNESGSIWVWDKDGMDEEDKDGRRLQWRQMPEPETDPFTGESVYKDGIRISYPMSEYFRDFEGEFIAVEINGKITFGLNNPAGVVREKPDEPMDFNITADVNSWRLIDQDLMKEADPNKAVKITIVIGKNVKVGAERAVLASAPGYTFLNPNNPSTYVLVSGRYALDLDTDITPNLHTIDLVLSPGAKISGYGGDGGNCTSSNLTNNPSGIGSNVRRGGGTAISCGSNLNIYCQGGNIIQGGGGGGSARRYYSEQMGTVDNRIGGGGGAGIPVGLGGNATEGTGNFPGANGTMTTGGLGGKGTYTLGGDGGNPGMPGKTGGSANNNSNNAGDGSNPGNGGNALRIKKEVNYTLEGITLGDMPGGVVTF